MMYYMPTKVIHEKNCIKKNGCLLKMLGSKALIVTGQNSAKNNGSQKDVEAALAANGQEFAIFDRIRSNPTLESVYEGAEEAKRFGADFVIGIGGGSPMDAAKAIGAAGGAGYFGGRVFRSGDQKSAAHGNGADDGGNGFRGYAVFHYYKR